MLPMGTIVTVCMFAGLIMAADLPVLRNLPRGVARVIAVIVLMAGLWNSLWYGLQHLSEFWGFAALISGVLMCITALYILTDNGLTSLLQKFKPIILIILACYAVMYAITIIRL
ncbi:MAG: hypothetical protein GKR95_02755 [Gammaproteobacteria bacterium]|nr:hypothetical protein [Gammaproteobacteria bacterium]